MQIRLSFTDYSVIDPRATSRCIHLSFMFQSLARSSDGFLRYRLDDITVIDSLYEKIASLFENFSNPAGNADNDHLFAYIRKSLTTSSIHRLQVGPFQMNLHLRRENIHEQELCDLTINLYKSLSEKLPELTLSLDPESFAISDPKSTILISKPCSPEESDDQDFHTDYSFISPKRKKLKHRNTPRNYPVVIFIALQDKTLIRVIPGSHKVKLEVPHAQESMKSFQELQLDKGEVLIMHPLLVHAGSSYDVLNFRVHYLAFDNDVSLQKSTHFLKLHKPIDQMIFAKT